MGTTLHACLFLASPVLPYSGINYILRARVIYAVGFPKSGVELAFVNNLLNKGMNTCHEVKVG
jgi:hypothetical protein